MTTDYKPRTGSVAHRAIEHMRGLGAEIALRPLADAVDSDVETLRMSLGYAVTQGAVIKTVRDGLCWFSLGSGKPLRTETEVLPVVRHVVSMQADDIGVTRPAAPGEDHWHTTGAAAIAAIESAALRPAQTTRAHETPAEVIASAQASESPPQTGHDLLLDRAFEAANPEAPKSTAPRLPPVFWISSDGGYEIRRGGVVTESFTKAEFIAQVAFLAEVQVPAQEAA